MITCAFCGKLFDHVRHSRSELKAVAMEAFRRIAEIIVSARNGEIQPLIDGENKTCAAHGRVGLHDVERRRERDVLVEFDVVSEGAVPALVDKSGDEVDGRRAQPAGKTVVELLLFVLQTTLKVERCFSAPSADSNQNRHHRTAAVADRCQSCDRRWRSPNRKWKRRDSGRTPYRHAEYQSC